jgi:hypothetical protein
MPLIWTPVHSTATWTTSPTAPRVARAALKGLGWLVATEFERGWSTTFVPDPTASDPAERGAVGSFHGAKVDWEAARHVAAHQHANPLPESHKKHPAESRATKAAPFNKPRDKRKP